MGFAENHVNICQYFALFVLRSLTCYFTDFANQHVTSAWAARRLPFFHLLTMFIEWADAWVPPTHPILGDFAAP